MSYLTWRSSDGEATVTVRFDRFDAWVGQPGFLYRFTLSGVEVCENTDLRLGRDDRPDNVAAMCSLASFVSAWAEAKDRDGSDNANLFPDTLAEWVDGYADEFAMDFSVKDGE